MKPKNTTAEMHADPLAALFTMGFPGGIERMEARGQQELVKGESLPSECSDKAALEAAGVVFGAPYPDDSLFCPATLPKGWKKQSTDHHMHSDLLDDKGRVRASIFYKAASYDRRADMRVKRRYNIDAYSPGKDKDHCKCVAMDGKTILQEFGETSDYDKRDELRKVAATWLNEKFPGWESPAAYWDAP